tara:strand:- start:104 stop:457 length:354 start_codon:yes stop_codon:yes gene_type:complete
MATYTVTKIITKPNTSTQWPERYANKDGYVNLKSAGTVSITASYDSDDLVQTTVFVWASKTDYTQNLRGAETRDSALAATGDKYFTYMVENNITGRITEEDGTVRVFNSSSKTFEVE